MGVCEPCGGRHGRAERQSVEGRALRGDEGDATVREQEDSSRGLKRHSCVRPARKTSWLLGSEAAVVAERTDFRQGR